MTRTRSLFRLSTLAGLVWAVAGAPSPAAAQGTDIQRLTLDHYLDMESEIYAVTVATRELRQLTNRRGPDRQPVPSPDGRLIAYIAGDQHQDTYRNQRIYVMNRDGSGSRLISGDYDRRSGGLQWAPDGSGLYFNVSREGYRGLHFISLEGGVTQLTEGKQLLTMSSFSDDGTAVGTIASAHEPGDLYRFSLRNPTDATRLTEVNADVLHGVTLGEVPR